MTQTKVCPAINADLVNIMTRTYHQDKTHRSKGITHRSMEFRRESPVATPHGLIVLTAIFFGALAAAVCARMIIESMRRAEISPAAWKCS